MSVVTRCDILRTLLRVQHVLMLTLCSLLLIPRALEVGFVVASPTTCRATPQMGGGTKEEAAVGGLGNPHEEEGLEEEDLEDEGEAVDLEKVRVDTFISRHKSILLWLCPYLRGCFTHHYARPSIPQGGICNLLPRQHHRDRSLPKV